MKQIHQNEVANEDKKEDNLTKLEEEGDKKEPEEEEENFNVEEEHEDEGKDKFNIQIA